MTSDENPPVVDQLLDTPHLAGALESDRFKQFLDQVPVAIAVSELAPEERVIYANVEFQRLSGQLNADVLGSGWDRLHGETTAPREPRLLGEAIAEERDYLGAFKMPHGGDALLVNAWSNIIEDDDGKPAFRLVALVEAAQQDASLLDELEDQVRDKDTQLRELQHRVRNNLQMITALIRVEARGVTDLSTGEGFDRLAGRVEALGLLYRALTDSNHDGKVDLGAYVTEIASAVMRAHATEGIHLKLDVETLFVSLDIAMPTGLVINELLTNALKHAFTGRDAGTIAVRTSISDEGCRVVVADDGVGLPEGYAWPKPGKLSALIVRSLIQNANARLDVQSTPGQGMRVVIDLDGVAAARAA